MKANELLKTTMPKELDGFTEDLMKLFAKYGMLVYPGKVSVKCSPLIGGDFSQHRDIYIHFSEVLDDEAAAKHHQEY